LKERQLLMAQHEAPAQHEVLPRGVLLAIGALVLVSLAGTAVVRLAGISIHEPDAATVASRSLRFDDGADGSVVVIDAATGATAARLTGEQGFVRGTLRALVRERKQNGVTGPDQQPFQLASHADGRLTLVDPVTGRHIDLESFGPKNAGVFARLLNREADREANRELLRQP
jgi:putative photosynthetic complex assembly protein